VSKIDAIAEEASANLESDHGPACPSCCAARDMLALVAVARAAEEVERWSQVHGVETVKDVAMDALRDALKALKGET